MKLLTPQERDLLWGEVYQRFPTTTAEAEVEFVIAWIERHAVDAEARYKALVEAAEAFLRRFQNKAPLPGDPARPLFAFEDALAALKEA